MGFSHLSSCRVENAAVSEEASREASEDDDLILADLDDTGALSLCELRRWHIDDDPAVGPVLRVVPLNRVAVLLARLCNSAEDKDEALIVSAARVVVATDIHVGNLEPKVQIDVVLLAALECIIFLAS